MPLVTCFVETCTLDEDIEVFCSVATPMSAHSSSDTSIMQLTADWTAGRRSVVADNDGVDGPCTAAGLPSSLS